MKPKFPYKLVAAVNLLSWGSIPFALHGHMKISYAMLVIATVLAIPAVVILALNPSILWKD